MGSIGMHFDRLSAVPDLILLLCCSLVHADLGADTVSNYNVLWERPSKSSAGSMPIGNGDIGLNVWVEEDRGLSFYISKTDAWSENARLLKLGRINIQISPSLFEKGAFFRQELRLREGEIVISAGPEQSRVVLRVWVDANHPVIRIEASGRQDFELKAALDVWRTQKRQLTGEEANSARGLTRNPKNDYPISVYPDVVEKAADNTIVWYHRNRKSCYGVTLRNQHLAELLEKHPDPLMNRTFGSMIKGSGLVSDGNQILKSSEPATKHTLSIYPYTAQTKTAEIWQRNLQKKAEQVEAVEIEHARKAHRKWWSDFWDRSWIRVSGGSVGPKITTNDLPLRIGADSDGANRFKGYIGAVSVFDRALKGEEIAALAAQKSLDTDRGLVGKWSLGSLRQGKITENTGPAGPARQVGQLQLTRYADRRCVKFDGSGYLEIADSKALDFEAGCTLAAWIAPDKLGAGGARIIDKSRAGSSNGYLLDTYPGNSLRLIVDSGTLIHKGDLEPGEWVHTAATYDASTGKSALYINGSEVASRSVGGDAFTVTRGYVLQRWINACGGRGAYPIKFNGSIFTVDAHIGQSHFDADYRRWGGMYWWQNTRLPYWSMLAAGDFDLMTPLFEMYRGALGLCKDKTRIYYDHGGAFFPETMYFWGTNGNCDYGWGHPGPETLNRYIRREWQGGIELTAIMLDYYDLTQDERFARQTLLPIAIATMEFFDKHWPRDQQGKLRFEPSQALETWWECVNPMPEVAGLRHIAPRLLDLPAKWTEPSVRRNWRKTLEDLPPVPTGREGEKRFLKPAEEFAVHRNSENPELYAVWPYRLYGLGAGNLDLAMETWHRRSVKESRGWRQDAIQAAYLGLGEQAAHYVAGNFSKSHSGSRFPAFWGPNFDWIPDQDHGSVACTALQRMLLQSSDDKILVMPAWPADWDVQFKLHAPTQTTVRGTYKAGKLIELNIVPGRRASDVRLPKHIGR